MTANCYKGYTSPHVPSDYTRGLVAGLYLAGTTQEKIAERLDINVDTLRKYYRKELDENLQDVTSEMVGILIRLARTGNLKALTFYLRTIGKLYEAKAPENNQADNKPTIADIIDDASKPV